MVSIDSVEGADHEYVARVNQNLENKNEKKISSRVVCLLKAVRNAWKQKGSESSQNFQSKKQFCKKKKVCLNL